MHVHFVHTADILVFIQSVYEPTIKVTGGGGGGGDKFMNNINISMSQTCLYNIFYRQVTRFLDLSLQREHLAIVRHNTNFVIVHS